jgi:hypothetical protein
MGNLLGTSRSRPGAGGEASAAASEGYTLIGTGCSAAWLARRVWVAEVAGSNPASPTKRSSVSVGTLFTLGVGLSLA